MKAIGQMLAGLVGFALVFIGGFAILNMPLNVSLGYAVGFLFFPVCVFGAGLMLVKYSVTGQLNVRG
jgi:hypothetical protein